MVFPSGLTVTPKMPSVGPAASGSGCSGVHAFASRSATACWLNAANHLPSAAHTGPGTYISSSGTAVSRTHFAAAGSHSRSLPPPSSHSVLPSGRKPTFRAFTFGLVHPSAGLPSATPSSRTSLSPPKSDPPGSRARAFPSGLTAAALSRTFGTLGPTSSSPVAVSNTWVSLAVTTTRVPSALNATCSTYPLFGGTASGLHFFVVRSHSCTGVGDCRSSSHTTSQRPSAERARWLTNFVSCDRCSTGFALDTSHTTTFHGSFGSPGV
jgi:hypothetical protein